MRVLALIWLTFASCELTSLAQEVSIQVRENAGIRRFGYPVTAPIQFAPGSLKGTHQARLVNADAEGKPLAAQITAISRHSDGSLQRIEVDFNLSPGPLETTKLKLEYGPKISAVEPKQGLTFAETEDAFQVSAYTVRKDAHPLISKIRYGREYLKEQGLNVMAWSGGVEHHLHTAKRNWTVEKQGPFQVRLRCDGSYPSQGETAELPFTLLLEFVSSKSWVGLRHSLHATPEGEAPAEPQSGKRSTAQREGEAPAEPQSGKRSTARQEPRPPNARQVDLGIAGDFQLAGRLLWDTDVNYWLYGVLEASEQMKFSQRSDGWLCELGKVGRETPYAINTESNPQSKRWGHFQEAKENGNVIAFGFSGASATGDHSFTFGSDGKLLLRCTGQIRGSLREPSVLIAERSTTSAELNAFFHFIPVPAQHTARTSPAAMMLPLEVTVHSE